MTDSLNRTATYILTILLLFTAFSASFAQEIKRDTTPVAKDGSYWFLQGMREFNNKNFTAAKEAFQKLVEFEPDNDAAYYYLSNIALAEKDIETAEAQLKMAVEKDSTNYWYNNLLARIFIATNQIDKAVAAYEGMLSMYPKKTDIYYSLSNLYISQKNSEKAHETLNKIEQARGKDENTSITRFNLYRMDNDWETAISVLEEDSKKIASPRIETILADMYSDQRKDSMAIVHYEKALNMAPGYIPALYGQAEHYRRNNNFAGFFNKIAPVIANPEVESSMKTEYFEQLFKIPNFVQKCKPQLDILMESLANVHPSDSLSVQLSAAYFAQTGDKEKCRKILKTYIASTSEESDATMRYLSFLYYDKQWEELEAEALKAAENLPYKYEYYELAGISQYELGKYDKAIVSYGKINENAIKDKDTALVVSSYSTIGDLYHTIGNMKMAYACYKKALKTNPNYNPVLNNYAYFLAIENRNLKQACKMSRKTIETEPDNATYLDTYAWILHLLGRDEEAKAHLKHAMLYGGMEDKDVLLHYVEVLEALGEKSQANFYREKASKIED